MNWFSLFEIGAHIDKMRLWISSSLLAIICGSRKHNAGPDSLRREGDQRRPWSRRSSVVRNSTLLFFSMSLLSRLLKSNLLFMSGMRIWFKFLSAIFFFLKANQFDHHLSELVQYFFRSPLSLFRSNNSSKMSFDVYNSLFIFGISRVCSIFLFASSILFNSRSMKIDLIRKSMYWGNSIICWLFTW